MSKRRFAKYRMKGIEYGKITDSGSDYTGVLFCVPQEIRTSALATTVMVASE